MTTYCAVVKYPVDAELKVKRRVLLEGLGMICMKLVVEHDYDIEQIESALDDAQSVIEQIESALDDAQSDADHEYDLKQTRDET